MGIAAAAAGPIHGAVNLRGMQEPSMAALVDQIAGRQPGERLRAVAALRRQLEALEADYVADAVRLGWSWNRIGAALGITRQTAHRKHSKRTGRQAREEGLDGRDTEVLVTSEAWRAVRFARAEARGLRAGAVGTEHLLLGLIRADEGAAGDVMRRFGVSISRARAAVESTAEVRLEAARAATASVGSEPAEPDMSPLARSVLELSLREALRRGDSHLSGEHLLLALLRDESGGAPRTLARLRVHASALEQELEQVL
jgi:hypothetical protein